MKVYIVMEDNGLEYSDHEEWVEKVFNNLQSAEKYIQSKGFTREDEEFYYYTYHSEPCVLFKKIKNKTTWYENYYKSWIEEHELNN